MIVLDFACRYCRRCYCCCHLLAATNPLTMPPRSKRRKRDSAANLYRHCQLGGDCIPDVVNKYEHKTPADRILQIGSSLTYFGGQGIGTGTGSGGSTGYRPLPGGATGGGRGTGVRIGGVPTTIVRRPIGPVDTIGSADIIPIDPVASGADVPSVIPLEEVSGTDITVGGDVNVVGEVLPPGSSGGPSITTGEDTGEVAVLEVGSTSGGTQGERVSSQQFSNPSFVAVLHSTPTVGEGTYGSSVLVSTAEGGSVIGGMVSREEIPLQTFSTSVVHEPGLGPRTSTPRVSETSLFGPSKGLYGRRVQQVPVSDTAFLGRPRSLAVFENPAFVGDDGSFELPLQGSVEAAPHEEFRDLHRLGRLSYTQGPGGRLRIGRLGTKATMRLRSGTFIGPQVHYYQDLSTIDNIGSIELSVFGEQSGDSTLLLDTSESTFVNVPLEDAEEEALLLDDLQEDFSNAQLSFTTRGRTVHADQPRFRSTPYKTPVVDDIGDGLFVSYPDEGTAVYGDRTHVPTDGQPSVLWDPSTGTFDLHPSLIPVRKRRRHHELL
ncbi:L2 protein [Felis catus papillomavirus 6]|uniref:Minor capsid protein L2 n=1 Tax=Felis catus papillomavirus 6 TaxID=2704502 RepID=A0A6B9WBS0_9PAPI|nr:L2 protein [Felis catus papillomavirus 6]